MSIIDDALADIEKNPLSWVIDEHKEVYPKTYTLKRPELSLYLYVSRRDSTSAFSCSYCYSGVLTGLKGKIKLSKRQAKRAFKLVHTVKDAAAQASAKALERSNPFRDQKND